MLDKHETREKVIHLRGGDVLAGKYRLLKPLGKGGGGSVWLALHMQTEQFRAVKEIPRQENGREFHELNMIKKLHHPALAQILDVLEESSRIYLIMEYIRGQNLEELSRKRGCLTVEQTLDAGLQISGALCYLHSRKTPVYHLDIKPANIICRKDGRLVLVDFGAAWKDSGQKEDRRNGTEGFAAPEQYDLTRAVDTRTDVYGLGATLYCLISGKRYSPVLYKGKIPGCPEALGEVIRKCLCPEPELRYADSRALYQSLTRIQRGYHGSRQRCRLLAALMLAMLSLGLAVRELPREFLFQAEENWNYEKILAEALCVPDGESLALYRRAVFLEPEREDAYLQYLRQAGADGEFTEEEERSVRMLLHTIPLGEEQSYEELLSQNPAAYGKVMTGLGLACWYDYTGENGRRLGSGWFSKAAACAQTITTSVGEETSSSQEGTDSRAEQKEDEVREAEEVWIQRAEIYAHMGNYFDRLGRPDESGETRDAARQYWQDQGRLLELDFAADENVVTALRFFRESMEQLVFLAEELRKSGITGEECFQRLELILEKMEQLLANRDLSELEERLRQEVLQSAQTAGEVAGNLAEVFWPVQSGKRANDLA